MLGPLHDFASQIQGELVNLLQQGAGQPAIFAACLRELQRTRPPSQTPAFIPTISATPVPVRPYKLFLSIIQR